MSQRLVSKNCKFVTRDGLPLWSLLGASPDTDDDATGSSGDDDGSEGTEGSEGQGEGDNGSEDTVTKADLDALKARMVAADKRASEAEKKVKEYEDKGKDVATKATERVTELEGEVTNLTNDNRTLKVQNAFLSANSVTWHDPDAALALADLSEVLDSDGNVDKAALKKALTDLSKAKPFLVKAADDKEKDGKNGPSGQPVGSGRTKDKNEPDKASLLKKYPALNR